ncbi:MAG: hypothetical protein GX751_09405 [Desulfuromonadaceae bacterium]|nr:hypothetical protein [Desulfuromonadaceae bacterium]
MRKWVWFIVLLALMATLVGCTNKNFLISGKDYQATVKTLGVLPLLVDSGSDITHPDREAVLQLIKTNNQGKIDYLVEKLKSSEGYFDVRPVMGDVDDLFINLIQGKELVTRPGSFYRSYQVNNAYAGELCRKNMVDGVLIIVLNGVVTPRKYWDRTRISYLQTDYNLVVESALVVSADGKLLWEYSGNPSAPFLPLQYPDFDEAHYNKTNKVRLKFITLNGLEKTLQEPSSTLMEQNTVPKAYRKMLNRVADKLKPGW